MKLSGRIFRCFAPAIAIVMSLSGCGRGEVDQSQIPRAVNSAAPMGIDNPKRASFYNGLKGKRVIFIPIAMGLDITEAWYAGMKRQANDLGYSVEVRDPNASTEMGIRAMTSAIADRADLIVLHNPDLQSYAKLIRRARDAGIKVLQLNMEALQSSDSYVGGDWVKVGEQSTEVLAKTCAPGRGSSNKIAFVTGTPTGAITVYALRGMSIALTRHPEIKLVAVQAGNYDPVKEKSITATILQQHPDLCGIMGIWDLSDTGIGSAVVEAGKASQVNVLTVGPGSKTSCDNIHKGIFSTIVNYNLAAQVNVLNQQITELLLSPDKAGSTQTSYFSPLTVVTKSNATGRNCWTMEDFR